MKLDWQRVLLNLKSAGVSVRSAARSAGMDPQTLRHYAKGECSEPRFWQGLALLDLHLRHCPEKHRIEELRR